VKEIILSSQETGVLYLYESSSGFVLKSVGDEKIQPIYKGEITNGKPNVLGFNSPPLGAKVFDYHSNTQLLVAG